MKEAFKLGAILDKVSFLQVSKQKLHLIHGLTDYQVSNCVACFIVISLLLDSIFSDINT